ncbi:hypothetical protein K505DRAFT_341664 [Melanomma pulvis-pyrius CBS 109.77]|uniref:AA1-like domain-containing protein n=1 Tax=Melanomma pulvis-pyrius CBS 109.77 TaxID=1314802 RepID=A0A6A6WZ44_9PLEO|nr:hypothetical protein K505DRAFT_341664 [Melanomma pulvis-pyrius CBS 109.77]
MRPSVPLIAAFVIVVRAAAVPRDAVVTRANDFGEWTFITYTTESIPGVGVQTRDATVQYSGQDTPVTCHWSYVPRNNPPETSRCSDPTFSYSLGEKTSTSQVISVTQIVVIDGVSIKLSGTGTLALHCGQGAGFSCSGSGTIEPDTVLDLAVYFQ